MLFASCCLIKYSGLFHGSSLLLNFWKITWNITGSKSLLFFFFFSSLRSGVCTSIALVKQCLCGVIYNLTNTKVCPAPHPCVAYVTQIITQLNTVFKDKRKMSCDFAIPHQVGCVFKNKSSFIDSVVILLCSVQEMKRQS